MPVVMRLCHDCGEGKDGQVKKEASDASISQGSKLSSKPHHPHRGPSTHSIADDGEAAGVARALEPHSTSLDFLINPES